MGGFASSRILEVLGERMIKRTFDPGFRIAAPEGPEPGAHRARQLGLALPNTANAQQLFNACVSHGGGLGPLGHGARAGELSNFEIGQKAG
jgi:2-hydroxy-3-oxopropionate reductase